MTDDPVELAAQHSYGYGRWSAPYWFIGPETARRKKRATILRSAAEPGFAYAQTVRPAAM